MSDNLRANGVAAPASSEQETPRLERILTTLLKGVTIMVLSLLASSLVLLGVAALRFSWEMAF